MTNREQCYYNAAKVSLLIYCKSKFINRVMANCKYNVNTNTIL